MFEKRFHRVDKQLFTANATANGIVTVPDTRLFKVKQKVIVSSTLSLDPLHLEVKDVLSQTVMQLGPKGGSIKSYEDLSVFTTGAGSYVQANEQPRSEIPVLEIPRFTYEEEPVVAWRTILVDDLGDKYNEENPFPVRIKEAVIDASLEVQISHLDNFPNLGDIADSVRIGSGTNGEFVKIDTHYTAADDGSRHATDGAMSIFDCGYSENTRIKNRLLSSPDVNKDMTWAEIDGVRRITEIIFKSASLDVNTSSTTTLTRTFTYQVADPYDLTDVDDVLAVV
jgi:hypothetical protein